ncbi:MAG TPA: YgiT-type zinc finger protein [Usitatibacter sp.]
MSAAIETLVAETACRACGGSDVHAAQVRSAFFEGERLVVVEDIPALVCDGCGEHFYDDATIVMLDLLRGEGFPPERARSELRVPVFSFGERAGGKDSR